ncbi:MAG: hypothetical protein WC734_06130 [Patescibacteria group bacterium]|jgi:hypothetical protein
MVSYSELYGEGSEPDTVQASGTDYNGSGNFPVIAWIGILILLIFIRAVYEVME